MIPDWQTNAVLISDRLVSRHTAISRRLEEILQRHGVSLTIVPGTADIWIQDAAPVQVADRDFVQFVYRPDYLRNGFEHLITRPDIFRKIEFSRSPEMSDIVLDGGNVVGTGTTAILTEKVFRENSNRSRGEIEKELRVRLRVEGLIFIPEEPRDIIGHSDGMVRFINNDTVIVNDYSSGDASFGRRLTRALQSHGLQMETLSYRPERRKFAGIESALGNYVNFLRVGNLIVLPRYGVAEDDRAVRQVEQLCPEATVTTIPSVGLAREGGVLRCVTWTVRVSMTRTDGDLQFGDGEQPAMEKGM